MNQESFSQLAQLSELKKQLTNLKISYQKQSYELEAEHQINIQLTSSNQQLHHKLKQSNNKLLVLQQRLNAMSDNYENQIEELKILVDSRSEELEELSRQLLPKVDEDMLRIRLLNELEIPHREELDEKEREISKMQEDMLYIQKDNQVLKAKIQYLQEVKQRQINEVKKEHSNNILVYKTEIEMLSEQNIKGLDYSKKLRKQIQQLKHKLTLTKQKHISEIEELNKENNKILMNYGSDHELRTLKYQIEQKGSQIREQKEEILRLRRQLDLSKEQYIKLQSDTDQLRNDNSSLRELADSYQAANLELKMAVEPVENYEASIRNLRKQIGLKNDEIMMLLEKIRMIQDYKGRDKDRERQRDKTNEKVKYQTKPEHQDDKTKQIQRLRQDIQVLSNNLLKKQQQYQQLSSKYRNRQNPRKEVRFDDKTFRNFRQRSLSRSPDRNLKQKLKQANAKIVELLKQKIFLKQEIIRLSHK